MVPSGSAGKSPALMSKSETQQPKGVNEMKLFKRARHNATTWYLVDDNTVMPIACDTYERALEIVNKDFSGEIWRIGKVVK